MAVLQTILTGTVGAALVTAVALGLQAWLQRRATAQQRRDDQAHELRMAQERHRADLERLDREASHRRREVNQGRLQDAHRALLQQLEVVVDQVILQDALMREVPEAARDYSVIAARLRGPVFSLGLPAEEVELLASKEVLAAAATAQSIAFLLQDECATPLGGVGMDSSRYIRLMLDLIAATNAYREAMRKDIGAA